MVGGYCPFHLIQKMGATNQKKFARAVTASELVCKSFLWNDWYLSGRKIRINCCSMPKFDVEYVIIVADYKFTSTCFKFSDTVQKSIMRFYRDLNSDRRIQSPEC